MRSRSQGYFESSQVMSGIEGPTLRCPGALSSRPPRGETREHGEEEQACGYGGDDAEIHHQAKVL